MANTYETYKDSGIAWIGEIPSEWKVLPIKHALSWKSEKGHGDAQVLSLYRDLGIIPKDSRDDNHNVTSEKTNEYKYVSEGNFVVNKMKAWQGSMALSHYNGIVSPAYYVFEFINNDVYRPYFHHLLRNESYLPEYRRLSTGLRVGQWDLGFEDFKEIKFLLPPLVEQQSIATFLDKKCGEIDSLIALQEEMISELQAYKQSVITEAVTKGLNPNAKLKDSGVEWIGEIPENWKMVQLKHLIDILPGFAFSSNDFATEGTPLLRGINVTPDGLRWEEVVYWNNEIDNSLSAFLLKEGDLVLGLDRPWISSGTRLTIVRNSDLPCLLLQRVCRIRTNCKTCLRYIYYSLLSDLFKNSLTTDVTGISVPHISTEQVNCYAIACPPLSEQRQIADYLDAKTQQIDSLITLKQEKIQELKDYKKSIIYEYVTGKKRV